MGNPVVVNNIVYFGSFDQNLYALKARTGAKLWSYQTHGQIWSTPVVNNGVIYVSQAGIDRMNKVNTVTPTIVALNATSGKLIWKNPIDATPITIYAGSRWALWAECK